MKDGFYNDGHTISRSRLIGITIQKISVTMEAFQGYHAHATIIMKKGNIDFAIY